MDWHVFLLMVEQNDTSKHIVSLFNFSFLVCLNSLSLG